MQFKFTLLESSWGIAIYLDLVQVVACEIRDTDTCVFDNFYIRTGKYSKIDERILKKWAVRAINDIRGSLELYTIPKILCFEIVDVDFSYTDFQEEGLYYAVQGWFSEYYTLNLPEVKAIFEDVSNRYIFPDLARPE